VILSALPPTTGVYINPNDWLGLTFRIMIACLMGGVIGWNREAAGKPAGLRTHMLVSLGAALLVMTPLMINPNPSIFQDALSRAIQGVATGVGFLGAGEILQRVPSSSKASVKGLTSAATIWVTAALGVLAGCGFWQLCLLGTGIAFVILSAFKGIERAVFNRDD
jgi:putative Mg2+ transporter-C (MgtC) family protein